MQQHSTESIGAYYDKYAERQGRIGKNLRHYFLFRKILKAGLKRNHKILEIGCGIGTFTELLANYIKSGKIIGTDISEESILFAKNFFKTKSNAQFFATDMSNFSYPEKFDFIVAADVLEHIPIENHPALFETFARHSHQDTIIFINIPHPHQIEILRIEDPGSMQIIDQPVYSDGLLRAAYPAGFSLHSLKSYQLFQKHPDYQLILFKKLKPYEKLEPLGKWAIIFHKTRLRIFQFFSTF